MMHVAMSVSIRTSSEGQAIRLPGVAHHAEAMIPELYGWEGSPPLTGLKIHTIYLTDQSQTANQSSPSLMIEGKVGRIRRNEEDNTISFWFDDHAKWVWHDDGSLLGDWTRL